MFFINVNNCESNAESLCKVCEPVIRACINRFPTYKTKYYNEMYNSAIVAVLENHNSYDSAKGGPGYFGNFIMSALTSFIAREVHGFSSIDQFRKYCAVNKAAESMVLDMTSEEERRMQEKTGIKTRALKNMYAEAQLSCAAPLTSEIMENAVEGGIDPEEHCLSEERARVIHKAMEGLNERETEFVYDMCGFGGRAVMSDKQLRNKYMLDPKEYVQYTRDLIRKLKGSRTLRNYISQDSFCFAAH